MFGACASAPTAPLDPATLALPAGSRVLLAEVVPNLLGDRLKPLARQIPTPDAVFAATIGDATAEGRLQTLVSRALETQPADMVFLFLPRRTVEKRYNPYREFRGWRNESAVVGYEDGRAVTRKKEVPRFDTRYKNRCIRVRYRILQYGPDAAPMGRADPETPAPAACPEKSDADVVIDEFDAAARWLGERIRDSGR